jgi:hypothetical protein
VSTSIKPGSGDNPSKASFVPLAGVPLADLEAFKAEAARQDEAAAQADNGDDAAGSAPRKRYASNNSGPQAREATDAAPALAPAGKEFALDPAVMEEFGRSLGAPPVFDTSVPQLPAPGQQQPPPLTSHKRKMFLTGPMRPRN